MTILSFKVPADNNDIFASDAFDHNVGKTIHSKDFGDAVLKAVEVSEDGTFAILTIDTDKQIKMGRGSYGKREETWTNDTDSVQPVENVDDGGGI